MEDICGVKRWWKRGSEAEVEELWTALLSRQGCRKWKKSCLWLEVQHAGAYGLRCVGLEAAPSSFGVVRRQLLRVGNIEGQPCDQVLRRGCPMGALPAILPYGIGCTEPWGLLSKTVAGERRRSFVGVLEDGGRRRGKEAPLPDCTRDREMLDLAVLHPEMAGHRSLLKNARLETCWKPQLAPLSCEAAGGENGAGEGVPRATSPRA